MNWFTTPLGAGGARRVTVPGCRKVLVIVPSVVAGTRLLDLLPVLDSVNGAGCVATATMLNHLPRRRRSVRRRT